ncbi:MAG: hypothetical protein K5900_12990 [Butyrivibrio sp.]|nr:hypothetical protein [Butyrivibrio sp.]
MVAQQQSEAINEAAKEQQKLFEIAMRIMKGGKVPPEDERKLAQAYPEMYQTAKSMAMMNRNKEKKEYDSVDEDDKNNVSEAEKEESGNTDSPLEHVDIHFVDINVTMGSDGGSVDAVSTETVSSL